MIASVAINGTLGLAMTIAVLFCIGNLDDALNSPEGFPFMEIFRNATNSVAGGTAMVCLPKVFRVLKLLLEVISFEPSLPSNFPSARSIKISVAD